LRVQRFDNEREALRPIVSIAGEKSHALGTAAGQKPEAVVLDFVDPVSLPAGRSLACWVIRRSRYTPH
jgi:hypothetical protein